MRSRHVKRTLLLLVPLALALATGCGHENAGEESSTPTPATPTPSPTPLPMDLSENLTAFEFHRSSGFGFCPPLHAVFRATIERGDDGRYHLRASILVPGGLDDPECIVIAFPEAPACAREVPLPERTLDDDEVDDVRRTFQVVLIFDRPDPVCERIAPDTCLIQGFTWTRAVGDVSSTDRVSFSVGDYPCASPHLPTSEVERMTALLGRLVGDLVADEPLDPASQDRFPP
jgi:hypothetical protein